MSSPLGAWRLPLRIARRDALRHRGRSVLVLVMIALPVLAVTAADVLMQTSTVSGVESIDRRMGASEALVTTSQGSGRVAQQPDPDDFALSGGSGELPLPTAERVAGVLGGARLLELRHGETEVRTDKGAVSAELTEVDLADPLTAGLFDLVSGRLPEDAGEVVVNEFLAGKGFAVGETLDRPGTGQVDPIIVGIAESTTTRDSPIAAGPLGAFGLETDDGQQWLADGGPVSWSQVRELNDLGVTVASRAVITDPPPQSEWAEEVQDYGGTDEATVAVLVLIVVMALIEVVLLAGPAFAVGARKQQRSLALMSATGGTPVQTRRVVIGGAFVLGSVAALMGVVVGIGLAKVLVPFVQSRSGSYLGSFDVPWLHLAGIAGFGLLSAFLAALVPAYIASRQDVVAVLAGRRGDRPPSLKSPLLGLVLLGIGIACSVVGATGGGEFIIAGGAIPAVLGMILLIPLVLATLGKVVGRLPLVMRYAVRDAARHRTRTVPAVAAVAATVAGVVALGISLTSDEAENRETYQPSVADGTGIVASYGTAVRWPALREVLDREIPDVTVTEQQGLSEDNSYTEVFGPDGQTILSSSGSSLGANIMVSDGPLPVGLYGMAKRDVAPAERALRAGGIVAFVSPGIDVQGDVARVARASYDPDTGEETERKEADLPAVFVTLSEAWAGPAAVFSPSSTRVLGVQAETVSLALSGPVSEAEEDAVNEALGGVSTNASLYVERGYQAPDETVIAQLILIGLGAVLMIGGTLTATFLALSDARPDLATLSAVGASPRTRRGVASAYALVVGFVGAVLGAAVGFIPGIAITYPLTSQSSSGCTAPLGVETFTCVDVGPFLDVPWSMVLGLVIVLPLLTAAVVALFTRSRLPLVARLD